MKCLFIYYGFFTKPTQFVNLIHTHRLTPKLAAVRRRPGASNLSTLLTCWQGAREWFANPVTPQQRRHRYPTV
jgi:hypothetical protein